MAPMCAVHEDVPAGAVLSLPRREVPWLPLCEECLLGRRKELARAERDVSAGSWREAGGRATEAAWAALRDNTDVTEAGLDDPRYAEWALAAAVMGT